MGLVIPEGTQRRSKCESEGLSWKMAEGPSLTSSPKLRFLPGHLEVPRVLAFGKKDEAHRAMGA